MTIYHPYRLTRDIPEWGMRTGDIVRIHRMWMTKDGVLSPDRGYNSYADALEPVAPTPDPSAASFAALLAPGATVRVIATGEEATIRSTTDGGELVLLSDSAEYDLTEIAPVAPPEKPKVVHGRGGWRAELLSVDGSLLLRQEQDVAVCRLRPDDEPSVTGPLQFLGAGCDRNELIDAFPEFADRFRGLP